MDLKIQEVALDATRGKHGEWKVPTDADIENRNASPIPSARALLAEDGTASRQQNALSGSNPCSGYTNSHCNTKNGYNLEDAGKSLVGFTCAKHQVACQFVGGSCKKKYACWIQEATASPTQHPTAAPTTSAVGEACTPTGNTPTVDSGNCCDETTKKVRQGQQKASFRTCAQVAPTQAPTLAPTPAPEPTGDTPAPTTTAPVTGVDAMGCNATGEEWDSTEAVAYEVILDSAPAFSDSSACS